MFPIVEVSGSARERGRRHGHVARDRIRISLATYSRLFAYCGLTWDDAQRKAAGYRDVIAALSPDLLDEIGGIADGAGLAETEVLALNARTEILPPTYPAEVSPHRDAALAKNRAAALPDWGECTALAVLPDATGDGKTWLAQNWDWIGPQRSALVLLRITDEQGRQALTLTEAGMLAKIGLNDRGLGVGLNILRSLDDGSKPGVPVHVLLRHLLDCDDVASAVAAARALQYGASSNIPLADAGGHAASLEISPRGVAVIEPHSGALARPLGRAAIFALLRDESEGPYSVCRSPDPAMAPEVRIETVCGVAMDLVERTMWIAPDVPARVEFEPVALAASSQAAHDATPTKIAAD